MPQEGYYIIMFYSLFRSLLFCDWRRGIEVRHKFRTWIHHRKIESKANKAQTLKRKIREKLSSPLLFCFFFLSHLHASSIIFFLHFFYNITIIIIHNHKIIKKLQRHWNNIIIFIIFIMQHVQVTPTLPTSKQ